MNAINDFFVRELASVPIVRGDVAARHVFLRHRQGGHRRRIV